MSYKLSEKTESLIPLVAIKVNCDVSIKINMKVEVIKMY